jgi:hypothetical protein
MTGAVVRNGTGPDRPASGLFASSAWVNAVAETYGFPIATSTCANHANTASLVFSHVADLRGERIISFPFSDYCDPLAEDDAMWRHLVAPLLDRNVPVSVRCLHNHVPAGDPRFTPSGRWAWHGVDLTRPEADLWAAISPQGRQNVRRAQRNHLVVRAGRSLDDVSAFYHMHCQVRKSKYRLLPQPWVFFERLHATFAPGGHMIVLLAEEAGVPLAATCYIAWSDTLYYKFNASVDRTSAPNDLLVWEGIRLGQQLGLKRLDLGASDLDQPGLLRFKRKYATEERQIVRYRWQPAGQDDPRGRQADRMLGVLTHLLTDPAVPDAITQAAGAALYGVFS